MRIITARSFVAVLCMAEFDFSQFSEQFITTKDREDFFRGLIIIALYPGDAVNFIKEKAERDI